MQNQKKHPIGMIFGVVCFLLLAAYLSLTLYLTFQDMERDANPTVFSVEEGVWNLTGQDLTVRAEELGTYILYTNSTKIQVTADTGNAEGKIGLTTIEIPGIWLQQNVLNREKDTVTFMNLSAADRYIVSCEGLDGVIVTVSDGVEVNFWKSLQRVQESLLDRIITWWMYERR